MLISVREMHRDLSEVSGTGLYLIIKEAGVELAPLKVFMF